MTADIPSVLSKDGTDGLGAVPSVLEESRTDYRGRPSDGTVDNTEWPCWTEFRDLICLREHRLILDRYIGATLCMRVQHRAVIDLRKDQIAIAADIKVMIGLYLCEPEKEQEGVDIVVPESCCLFKTIEGVPESENDQWYICMRVFMLFWPTFGEYHIHIIVIVIGVEKHGDYVQVINVPSTSYDQRHKI